MVSRLCSGYFTLSVPLYKLEAIDMSLENTGDIGGILYAFK